MKVSLVDYTGKGTSDPARHAAAILIFTKSTRLALSPSLLNEILLDWPDEKVQDELAYMANTIPSSWEFCHYTFLIEGVTRAFTHQLVRTRTASFAQQTMRVLDVKGWQYGTGPTVGNDPELNALYEDGMEFISDTYDDLIEGGAKIEDARGILPTNILTNIVMGINLRNLADTFRKRSSPRVQGEYRDVLREMILEVGRVHPWSGMFFDRTFDRASADLDAEVSEIADEVKRTRMMKLVDQMRATQ